MAFSIKALPTSYRPVNWSKFGANGLKWIFLLVVAILVLFPIVYVLLGAFKNNQELTSGNNILPDQWNFDNFVTAWNIANFGHAVGNSLFICFWAVVLGLFTSTMTAYCLARREFPGRKVLMVMYTSLLFISLGPLNLRPIYELAVGLGVNNSLWPVVFMLVGSQAAHIFILQSYMRTLPLELDEAARMDGASFFRIYWQIILPLCKPAIGVVALFEFREAWNDYLHPLIFTLSNQDLRPLSVTVTALRYSESAATQWNLMLTGAAMSIIPLLIVYFFTSRNFISGLTSGAVKG